MGFILYQGPSMLDDSPIVAVYLNGSINSKTGNLSQTYILRSDMHPVEASRTGADSAICGDCKHRGKPSDKPTGQAIGRSCYVNLAQGVSQVYKAFKAGKYKPADNLVELGQDQRIRLGSYGDPAAVPGFIWRELTSKARGFTGYSHQHRTNIGADYQLAMYSADSEDEARKAQARGYRTFRVISLDEWQGKGSNALMKSEILCPASKESPHHKSTQCMDCMLCNGTTGKGKNIAIVAHGIGAKHAG